jgi:retron-type reverse transcriptase
MNIKEEKTLELNARSATNEILKMSESQATTREGARLAPAAHDQRSDPRVIEGEAVREVHVAAGGSAIAAGASQVPRLTFEEIATCHDPRQRRVANDRSKLNVIRKIQLNMLQKIKNNELLPTFRNLIPIISDIAVLTQAHTNLYKKKGATRLRQINPRQDFPTVDGMNIEDLDLWSAEQATTSSQVARGSSRLLDISNKLKTNTYIPSPVFAQSAIMILKPGKKKLRPLRIRMKCHYDDKIVSEAMRLLLNAIYDPLFQKTNVNHGFRPGRSPHTAIHRLSNKIQGLNLTINGDIDSAYPSVNHETLIKILRERIHDQKFLDLVWKFCRAGLYDFNTQKLEQTLLGVPQGQIASPIIFNIYFQKFDEKVIELLDEKIKDPRDRMTTTKGSAPSGGPKVQVPIRYYYIRYADDWIIFTNGNTQFAENIKMELSEFLHETLQMNLSFDKTKIIDITREPTTFLGFAIGKLPSLRGDGRRTGDARRSALRGSLLTEVPRATMTMTKGPTKGPAPAASPGAAANDRTQGNKVFINPDFERIITRLNLKSHCDLDGFPRESPQLSTQNPDVIISQCNTIMEGLINYYFPVITSPSQLQRIGYILQYSAYKTLAQKFKVSVRKIMTQCGGPKNPQYPLEINGEIQKLRIHDYYWILENQLNLQDNRDKFRYPPLGAEQQSSLTELPNYETQIWEECYDSRDPLAASWTRR